MSSACDVVDLSEVSEVVSRCEERYCVPARFEDNRDRHDTRMVATRFALDRLVVHEFVCTPYDNPAWDALRPAWMLTVEEQMTWRAVVPIVCFMYVGMHHVNRVKRQLGGEQQVPVNLDGFLDVSTRGEDQWWPTKHEDWYTDWKGRFEAERQMTITPTDTLDDPRLDDLPDGIHLRASQQRDRLRLPADVPLRASQQIRRRRRLHDRKREPAHLGWEVRHTEQEQSEPDIGGDGDAQADPVIGDARRAHDATLDDDFFRGAEQDFATSFGASEYAPAAHVDPSIGFIATVSGSQADDIAARYRRARGAPDTQQVSVSYPAPPSTMPNMSWVPPLSPPSASLVAGFSGMPRQQFGTPPSWEYPPIQSDFGSAPLQPAPPQPPHTTSPHQQVICPIPQRPHRQRQPPPCSISSHLQHPPHQ
ncbi:hypothetical protein PIB30_098036 [Stylosanthes scabra]|uniref:Aminotransferase-like plant mobile domain-containing protein n=1 Tax=Stylosanthes scabra TaxID=79078 RepID=A0ABU6SWR9_9FABA|nr:hypothetical protein [Stylosanthes scabra]